MRRFLLLLPLLACPAVSAKGRGEPPPPRHVLDVTLDPAAGTIAGTDRLTLPYARRVEVMLHDGLVVAATCDGRAVAIEPGEPGRRTLSLPSSCRGRDGLATIEVTLSGRIVDPVKDEPSLHFVTGGRTSGLITTEGAFLAGGTGWYPETGGMALYDASVTVPEAWSVVSQGDLRSTEGVAGGRRFRYASDTPADGLAMSAGPYVVTSRDSGGVRISTYLFQEHAELADVFLDAAAPEIERLAGRLGGYPGTKFDIVENFFTTGYGFPTYTLLGQEVIGMGARALRPGYLDHEIAHVWFGNHVSVDLASGNWCEGLTTYVTNYLNTAAQGEAQALEARQRVSQRYSVDVPAAKDFAPRAFREKTDDAGASVGYGKVSMVFHVLERELGEDVLWAALKDFVARHGGRRASWDDLRGSFERASSKDLRAFFAQWIDRPGLPQVRLENARRDGDAVTGEIVQEAPAYAMTLDVAADMGAGAASASVAVSGERTPFRIDGAPNAVRVTIDPGWHVPRRVAPEHLPASLARTLAAPDLLVVYPDPPEPADAGLQRAQERLAELARRAVADHGRAMPSKEAAQAEVEGASVLLLGSAADNRWVRELAPAFGASGADITASRSFRAGNRRFREPKQSLLVSVASPHRPGATWSAWVPNGPDALDNSRLLFFYGWDTWVAQDGGRAVARATTWPNGPWTVALGEPADTPESRLMSTVRALVDPALEGRASGTAGGRRTSDLIAKRLAAMGLDPLGLMGYEEPFEFVTKDLAGWPVLFWREDRKAVTVPMVPATEWLPAPTVEEAARQIGSAEALQRLPVVVPLSRGIVYAGAGDRARFTGLDLKDAAVVVHDDRSPGARERIDRWIDQARLREARALIVVRPGSDWPGEPGLVLFPAAPDPAKLERLTKLKDEGGYQAVERAIAGEVARTPSIGDRAKLPLYFAGDQMTALLGRLGLDRPGERALDGVSADLRMTTRVDRRRDVNLLGHVPGTAGTGEAVLLTAHHDGLGETADGTIQQGAADNAAGVAVLLEVARRLKERPTRRDVIVGSLSGEEWGLQGSRALAAAWVEPKLAAVLNVDTVGHPGAKLHVVGRSREPKLAAVVEDAARAAGLEVGGDIDRYADRDGSDHWPWVAKGVPAVDVFQADYQVINGPKDTAERLDPATLAKVADAVESSIRAIADAP